MLVENYIYKLFESVFIRFINTIMNFRIIFDIYS